MILKSRLMKWVASVSLLLSATVYADENYTWDSMAIGGGGFVSAVVPSKTEKDLFYARTDVGGAYRWDKASERWVPLTDWVSEDQIGFLGVESIALDPQNSANVYMLAGISYFNGGKTAILRSNDYGKTFAVVDVSTQFKAHGNGMGRQSGEKLQVDPANSNIIYAGTRWNGLFKSNDAGVTWARLSGLNVTTTPNENGLSFVLLDPTSVSGGSVQKIFVGVSRFPTTGANFYRSDDGGNNFTAVTGGPAGLIPQRAVIAKDGNIFITFANGAGPHGHWNAALNETMDNGQVWKFNPSNNAWTNITPAGVTRPFSGISVDPNNENHLVLTTINTYLQQYGNAYGDRIYSTTNAGASWTDVVARGFALDAKNVSWIAGHAIHWAGSIEFDPFNTKSVLVTSGNGIFKTADIDATPTVWAFNVAGLEETVPLNIVSIFGGPLISTIGDYDGFRHTDVAQYAPIHTPQMGTTTGLDVAALDTNIVVRVGNKPGMYYSTDKGVSWNTVANMNGKGGQVALAADGKTLLHSAADSTTSYYSTNWGATWTAIVGLNVNSARPVADPVNKNKFYALNGGTMMVSTNGGISFSAAGNLSSANGSKVIRIAPGNEGHIWVALNDGGLARSVNSGSTFSVINGVTYAGAVGFGKAAEGANYPTVFVWGTINGVLGIYRSTDSGANWVRVNDDAHQYGGPGNGQFVVGDMNSFGVVYMSTAGRGIVYGKPVSGATSSAASSSSSSSSSSSATSLVSSSSNNTSSSSSNSSSSTATTGGGSTNGSGGGGGGAINWVSLLVLAAMAFLLTMKSGSRRS